MNNAPLLTTARLLLRPAVPDDVDAIYALTAAPEAHRFLGIAPSIDDTYMRFLRGVGCWALYGFGPFSAFDRASGALVANVGHFMARRGLGADFDLHPEALWVVAPERWGEGLALEAAKAAQDWLDAAIAPARMVCIISPGNAASIKVAERLGYHETGLVDYKGEPVTRYARDAAMSVAAKSSPT